MNPAEFGAAMNRAGYKRPAGAARWQSWLTANAPFVRITGTGAATRFLID